MRLWKLLAVLVAFVDSVQAQDALRVLAQQLPKRCVRVNVQRQCFRSQCGVVSVAII